MKYVRVAAASVNQVPMDWEGNADRIVAILDEAADKNIGLLCLPELCITGYGCEDMFLSPHLHKMAQETLFEVVRRTKYQGTYAVGLPIPFQNGVYNCMAVVSQGKVRGLAAKQNLAKDGLHYEPRWFRPWPKGRSDLVYLESSKTCAKVMVGDVIFEGSGIRFGFEICEDAWVAERTGARLARRNVDIILSPAASHFAFNKQEVRRGFVREGSRAFECAYVYANLLGNESGRVIFDGATLIASNGSMITEGQRFEMGDYHLIEADINLDTLRQKRFGREGFQMSDELPDSCSIGTVQTLSVSETRENHPYYPHVPHRGDKRVEFLRAMTLGLFDYLRKAKVQGYVVSLSGGADSAAAAVLVWAMLDRALDELGAERTQERLSHITKELTVKNLLTTVYQSTRNSSDTTKEAAKAVASQLGAKHLEVDVDFIVENYKAVVGDALGVEWDADQHDVPLQNIQARTRSPLAWMIANTEGKILLATSNRSEAAVGYATMDGDTSGGLSPLGGIDKAYLIEWLRQMSGFLDSLNYVLNQKPTAELKPDQTDEDDLMPYEVLDKIERLAIRDKKGPVEIYHWLKQTTDHDGPTLKTWVSHFFRLWCRNQWKRERYAPSFHVDEVSLDPRSWCRFPILSGGFEFELAQLQKESEDD